MVMLVIVKALFAYNARTRPALFADNSRSGILTDQHNLLII